MYKPVSVYIGLRYLRANRRNHFISFISLTSITGLTLGVMVMILVLSVLNGFHQELRERILGMVPHSIIKSYDGPITHWQPLAQELEKSPDVIASAPYTSGQGMLSFQGSVRGVMVNGILPAAEAKVSIVDQHMVAGSIDALKSGEFGIVLGDLVARSLGARMGDKITLLLPEASVSLGGVFPRMKRFTVVGIFSVGAELDASVTAIHIEDAGRVFGIKGQVEGIRLKFVDLFEAPRTSHALAAQLPGGYYSIDWTRTQGNLFQAIQLEKRMLGLLMLIIVAVAVFNIVSSLVMLVVDKQADIAVLKTLGADQDTIMKIFIILGSTIGFLGCSLGALMGIGASLVVSDVVQAIEQFFGIQFLNAEVYFISYLPSDLHTSDVLLVTGSAFVMSFIATLYPAYSASRTDPAEVLRYE
ncbi:MAG: lipoprotein-releasing ABC transporter permease subunit [Pseudomonadales bacterium]|nr:lipoprotein-releasing ABC transporter permease subunit [Pseudomonadales bacterium]